MCTRVDSVYSEEWLTRNFFAVSVHWVTRAHALLSSTRHRSCPNKIFFEKKLGPRVFLALFQGPDQGRSLKNLKEGRLYLRVWKTKGTRQEPKRTVRSSGTDQSRMCSWRGQRMVWKILTRFTCQKWLVFGKEHRFSGSALWAKANRRFCKIIGKGLKRSQSKALEASIWP